MNDLIICPICGTKDLRSNYIISNDTYDINCSRCKRFTVSSEFVLDVSNKPESQEKRHRLSGLLNELNAKKVLPPKILTTTDIDKLLSGNFVPSDDDIDSKANRLLKFLKEQDSYGKTVILDREKSLSVAYARDKS